MPATYYEKSKRIYEHMRAWADKFTIAHPEGSADLFELPLIWIKPFWRGPPVAPISLPYRRIAT